MPYVHRLLCYLHVDKDLSRHLPLPVVSCGTSQKRHIVVVERFGVFIFGTKISRKFAPPLTRFSRFLNLTHNTHYTTHHSRGDERNRSREELMALSRRSLATLSMLASASLTAEALTVEAGTIVGVSVDAPVYDTRSSAPYGCPPAGCLGDNTRVSASWKSRRARHLLLDASSSLPWYVLHRSYECFSHPCWLHSNQPIVKNLVCSSQ